MSQANIVEKSKEYDEFARKGELFLLDEHDSVDGGATKDDMIALYEQKFVPKNQVCRKYYDKIILLAHNGRCPYCGQQIVKTLDHYLPKTLYPTFAITPYNLVPSCDACNKIKMTESFDSYEQQTIHPYYDDFTDEVWIKAHLVEEEPIIFEIFVDKPTSWDIKKYMRAQKHFKDFNLNGIYKSYSAEEYIACESRIKKLYAKGEKTIAVEYLEDCIEDKLCIRKNTWQAAIYQALIDSNWYWNYYISTQI